MDTRAATLHTSIQRLLKEYPEAQRAAHSEQARPTPAEVVRHIDHTLLKAEATPAQVDQLCAEARQYQFASVCINPVYVAQCAAALRGSPVKVCTVVGFPLGATATAAKVFETQTAIEQGASEIDMVIHVGRAESQSL